jgi:hypothetical protein
LTRLKNIWLLFANNLNLSNKITGASNLLAREDRFSEYVVVVMVVQALPDHVKGKCEETATLLGESLNTFHILNRHLEAIDQLQSTYSLKRKPSLYSNYPLLPLQPPTTLFCYHC